VWNGVKLGINPRLRPCPHVGGQPPGHGCGSNHRRLLVAVTAARQPRRHRFNYKAYWPASCIQYSPDLGRLRCAVITRDRDQTTSALPTFSPGFARSRRPRSPCCGPDGGKPSRSSGGLDLRTHDRRISMRFVQPPPGNRLARRNIAERGPDDTSRKPPLSRGVPQDYSVDPLSPRTHPDSMRTAVPGRMF